VAFDSSTSFGPPNPAAKFDSFSRLSLQHRTYRNIGKRMFDLLVVSVSAFPALIILSILALIISLDGRSPFYSQNRVGRNGRVFRMFKLRSMVAGADDVLESYLANNPDAKAEWDRTQKLKNDPRITGFGKIIRATSMDELPQIINVLLGEMSIVGPRPMMCDQRALYPGSEYYAMRPGITGFWQISVRNESSFSQRAQFDRTYFMQLSFLTDLKVILRTFGVVLRATGH